MGLFKKKQSKELDILAILVEYVKETRNLHWAEEEIKDKIKEKGYSEEWIALAFKEADKEIPFKKTERRNKMPKKQRKEEDEYDEELDDEDNEDLEEDEEESPRNKKETRGRPRKEVEDTEEEKPRKIDINQVLSNHEQRLQQLEAAFFRVRGSI